VLLALLLVVLFAPVHALVDFYEPFDDFNFGTWNGQGSASLSSTACIRAEQGSAFADYRLKAMMTAPAPSPASPMLLYNLANSAITVPFSLELEDLHGGGQQTLSPDVFSNVMRYSWYCFALGPNARLTMNIRAADLYAVPAGDYSARMDLEARRVNSGGGLTGDRDQQTGLLGQITVPALVRISGIDDIALGLYDGVSAIVAANESYCIYTNTGNYTITPSSTTGSSPGSFALLSGSDQVEYTVKISNSTDASSGIQLENNQSSGPLVANQGVPLSPTCSGGDNAAVHVEISGSELQGKSAGIYSGTLTLQVAPI
jgi:hypothetical protein